MLSSLINLSTRAKLACSLGAMTALFVLVIGGFWWTFEAYRARDATKSGLLEVAASFTGQRSGMLAAALNPDPAEQQRLLREVADSAARGGEILRRFEAAPAVDADLARKVREIHALLKALMQTRDEEVLPLLAASKAEEARRLLLGVQAERSLAMRDLALQIGHDIDEKSTRSVGRIHWALILAGLTALSGAGALVWALNRLIARPLGELAAAAERLSRGDLHSPVEAAPRKDEVGLLQASFQHMRNSLRQLADRSQQIAAGDLTGMLAPQSAQDALGAAFTTMTSNLRSLLAEMIDASEVLAAAHGELSAAAAQMAASALETAAAVSQTTATVEEVKHAAGASSETARRYSDQSQEVAKVSREGRHSVEELVAGMAEVRVHMDSVAASILSLNAQGQTIGGIIATVDDLAIQSKMLAINASIEAAKAGDGGQGFAVVAQHVKSLAEQSRQATNRVRGILTEIEKATNSAVLTTEQGSKAVEAGVHQSHSAGQTIAALADGVAHAAQATTQIAAASREQFVGMDQVARAMENIKEACARNASGARQTEATAQRLAALGQRLRQLVSNFKV